MEKYETQLFELLSKRYPDATIALHFSNPLELLVATILSAQCTDKRVNMVTPMLFKKYKTAKDYAESTDLATDIKSINFFNNKAKNIKKMAQTLLDNYNGKVPDEMDQLVTLPGVARKTANVVLSGAFGKNEGFIVDTHVKRISNRLALTTNQDPVKIEKDLMAKIDQDKWAKMANLFVFLGRDVCKAGTPLCQDCALQHICPSSLAK
jgi:endonuclease-3